MIHSDTHTQKCAMPGHHLCSRLYLHPLIDTHDAIVGERSTKRKIRTYEHTPVITMKMQAVYQFLQTRTHWRSRFW